MQVTQLTRVILANLDAEAGKVDLSIIEMQTTGYPIQVVELKCVSDDLDHVLSEDEKRELIDYLAFNPEGGEVLPCTEGLRKTRWRYRHNGKARSLRVVYYFRDLNMPLYMIAVYRTGEVIRFTKREEEEMARLVNELVMEHARKNHVLVAEDGPA